MHWFYKIHGIVLYMLAISLFPLIFLLAGNMCFLLDALDMESPYMNMLDPGKREYAEGIEVGAGELTIETVLFK